MCPLTRKRIMGQYFLDLGQSDFSYSTCPTCGLFYARGHENDEKVHKAFHRNRVQGIRFKGWQNERVASRLDTKGNRVIVVLSEDTQHQAKVKEVIDVMETEMGLTPGWLLERSCKVYLFISSSKKVVGCLMAEPIKFAFQVVPAEFQSQGQEKGGDPAKHDEHENRPSMQSSQPSQVCENKGSSEPCSSLSGLPSTGKCEFEVRGEGPMEIMEAVGDQKSTLTRVPDKSAPPANSLCHTTSSSPELISKEVLPHASDTVNQEYSSARVKMKTSKITRYFAMKDSHSRKETNGKSESNASNIKGTPLGHDVNLKLKQNGHNSGRDRRQQCMVVERDAKEFSDHSAGPKPERACKGKPSATFNGVTFVCGEDSMQGGKFAANVMLFGNIKFSREVAPRKRLRREQTQDLGNAILCTKTPVPAVCGVRVIWVSQPERRKGIGSHLLDAMRKTFCLGLVLDPSCIAFSQPTPEGRKFAVRYCQTSKFLVYTSS